MPDYLQIIIGAVIGILASVPVSLGLLLMLTRERARRWEVYAYDGTETKALTVREG